MYYNKMKTYSYHFFFTVWLLLLLLQDSTAMPDAKAATTLTATEESCHVAVDPVSTTSQEAMFSSNSEASCQATSLDVSANQSFANIVQSAVQNVLQSASITVPSYYLLWSPGSTKKLIVSTLWLAVYHYYRHFLPTWLPSTSNSASRLGMFHHNVVLPLGASACCAIQLILNLLGVGCAGFNTYLGPLRPYALAWLAYLSFVISPPTTVMGVVGVVVRAMVALLPEGVHIWNSMSTSHNDSNHALMQKDTLAELPLQATVVIAVPTMGCVACVNKINASLKSSLSTAQGRILDYDSWLVKEKGGRASVTLAAIDETELNDMIRRIQNKIHDAGFEDTTVDSIHRGIPEILGSNARGGATAMRDSNDLPSKAPSTGTIPPAESVTAKVIYTIPSMSCQGCITEIGTAARQVSSKVMDVVGWLSGNYEGGGASVTVQAHNQRDLEDILTDIQKAWSAAGFDDSHRDSVELLGAPSIAAVVTWAVPAMHCSECARSIDTAIQQIAWQEEGTLVESVASRHYSNPHTGGSTTVKLKVPSLRDLERAIETLEEVLQDQGFEEGLRLEQKEWSIIGSAAASS